MNKKYCLIQDNDCHWLVIPTDKKENFFKFLESEAYNDGVYPEYCEEVGGCTTLVEFTSFKIRRD